MDKKEYDILQVKVKDGNSKKFKCGRCHYQSCKKDHVKRHILGVHEKIKNHYCDECGLATLRKEHLKAHIDSVHKKIKNHVCEDCGWGQGY